MEQKNNTNGTDDTKPKASDEAPNGEYYYSLPPAPPSGGKPQANEDKRALSTPMIILITALATALTCILVGGSFLTFTGLLAFGNKDKETSIFQGGAGLDTNGDSLSATSGSSSLSTLRLEQGEEDDKAYSGSGTPGILGETLPYIPRSDAQKPQAEPPKEPEDSQEEPPAVLEPETPTIEMTIPQICKKVLPSIVGVACVSEGYFGTSNAGSGIVIEEAGYIITNEHLVTGAQSITVVLPDGMSYDAKLIGTDPKTDIAIIKIEAENLVKAEFGDSDLLEIGDLAIAIGNTMGPELQCTVTSGIISGVNRSTSVDDSRIIKLLQTNAAITYGNSGGALVNKYGQVVGLNSLMLGDSTDSLGFAVPINMARNIADELIQNGKVRGRSAIGVQGVMLTETYAKANNIPVGLRVSAFTSEEPITAGMRRGDIIVKINGTEITTLATYNEEKARYTAGSSVTITVYRDDDIADDAPGTELDLETILIEGN